MTNITVEDITSSGRYVLAKTSLFRGYVSRKISARGPYPYSGKYGIGYTIERPNRKSSAYSIREYWIEKGRNAQ